MNRVITHPVPDNVILEKDYKVRVRAVGEEDFVELSTYRVKVDMHDVQNASMAYFDFEGEAEVEISGPWYIYQVDIRPLSLSIPYSCDTKILRFTINKPANLSIELNKDRRHNLHLFAGEIETKIPDKMSENTLVISGSLNRLNGFGSEVMKRLDEMPKGRTLYIEPGFYYLRETALRLPSDTKIYLAGGAVIAGAFICSHAENIHIYGRGVIYQPEFHRYSGINGIRLSFSRNICIEDVIFINPPHYTVYIGGSKEVVINNIKAFSCEGWSDGIDIMSSENIRIQGGFLRNSDDCIAIYGSRWEYRGDSKNIYVKGLTVWADVAHPLNIGTHGNHEKEGDIIEDISFEDIDILEHNEYQEGYLGCMTINPGDKNTVRNISYKNIRIEPFKHGKLLDVQVKYNPDYNPAPGRRIEYISFQDIYYNGREEVTSQIKGYSEEFYVKDVAIENLVINGQRVRSLEEANIEADDYAYDIRLL
jgi:hypothetical protein